MTRDNVLRSCGLGSVYLISLFYLPTPSYMIHHVIRLNSWEICEITRVALDLRLSSILLGLLTVYCPSFAIACLYRAVKC